MPYQLTQTQKDIINLYKLNGQYSDAYAYVATILGAPVANNEVTRETQRWFELATEINGNKPTFVNNWIRTTLRLNGLNEGLDLTDDDIQQASDHILYN